MGKCRIITSAYILVRLLKMISSLLIFLSLTLHKINKRKLCSAIAQNICSICWVTTIHFRSNWIHTSSLACICQHKSIIRIILIYYCSWSLGRSIKTIIGTDSPELKKIYQWADFSRCRIDVETIVGIEPAEFYTYDLLNRRRKVRFRQSFQRLFDT